MDMAADGGLHSRRAPGRLEPGADGGASRDVPGQDWRAPGDGEDGGSTFGVRFSRWLADRGLARGQLGPSCWDRRKATVICDCSGVVVVRSEQLLRCSRIVEELPEAAPQVRTLPFRAEGHALREVLNIMSRALADNCIPYDPVPCGLELQFRVAGSELIIEDDDHECDRVEATRTGASLLVRAMKRVCGERGTYELRDGRLVRTNAP